MASGVYIKGIPEFQRRLQAIGTAGDAAFMGDLATEFVEASRRIAPEDTGALKRSIDVASVQARMATIKAGGGDVDYARAVEFGARPHEIKARRAARLRFFWERERVMFSGYKVNHPGTRAQPYFRPVVDTLNLALRVKSEIVKRWNAAA